LFEPELTNTTVDAGGGDDTITAGVSYGSVSMNGMSSYIKSITTANRPGTSYKVYSYDIDGGAGIDTFRAQNSSAIFSSPNRANDTGFVRNALRMTSLTSAVIRPAHLSAAAQAGTS
jgi:hypothetical protein